MIAAVKVDEKSNKQKKTGNCILYLFTEVPPLNN